MRHSRPCGLRISCKAQIARRVHWMRHNSALHNMHAVRTLHAGPTMVTTSAEVLVLSCVIRMRFSECGNNWATNWFRLFDSAALMSIMTSHELIPVSGSLASTIHTPSETTESGQLGDVPLGRHWVRYLPLASRTLKR